MKSIKTSEHVAELGLLLTTVVWGSTFFIIKDSVNGISPVLLVGYRFLIAAAILGSYLLLKKRKVFAKLKHGIILGILLFLTFVPQAIGLKYTSASNSGFITGIFVAFIPIFSLLFFRERTGTNKWLAVVISLIGLIILTGGLASLNFGDVITLITSMAIALHILLADRYVKIADPLTLSFQQFLFTGIAASVLAVLLRISFSVHSAAIALSVVYLAIFPSLGAYVVQFLSQKKVAALKVSLIFALEPVFAALFAWTVGKEVFVPLQAAGGLLIFAAIIVSELNFAKSKSLDEDLTRLGA